MLSEERRERILQEVAIRGRVHVMEFAARTGLSGMTIRRDLAVLAARGLVRRVHGGAVLPGAADAPIAGDSGFSSSRRPIGTVGFIVPDSNYYFPPVIRGAHAAARQLGLRLVLGVTNYDPGEEVRQLVKLSENGADGILLVTARPGVDDARTWDCLASVRPPVVLVERSAREAPLALGVDSVRSDHSSGTELAVDHLVAGGHRRIGLICRDSATASWIEEGYVRASSRWGLSHDSPRMRAPSLRWSAETAPDILRDFLDACLASDTRAAIVLPDDLAIGLLSVVEEAGLKVPEDFAIVSYDDEMASLASVPLTAVAPPKDAVGRQAMQTCFMRLGERNACPALRIELAPELHARESSP
ncbi:substrate-binding domain-containing protein [Microbacterium sp. LWH12-1.2]|uniref:substrate-binding domain-containing protein n=1 Tax=Microbacterium sp. LWH12-1.2 TaxID=3135259 RepID=UPI00341B6E8A